MLFHSRVVGCGAHLPERIVTNDELARRVETTDAWIVERTGIRQRHIVAEGERTSDLALAAARRALENGAVSPSEVDLIVLATTTPDDTFPATATKVQAALGIDHGAAFDVQAVCAGFVYALAVADNALRLNQAKTALVIGAETFSRLLDWQDRNTCVLFGDGAGAVVLRAFPGAPGAKKRCVLSTHLHSDGRLYDLLYVDGGPSSSQTVGHVRMRGREIFRHAVVKLAQVVEEALEANGLKVADIDWFVPHQANQRIIDSTAKKLGLADDKVIKTVERHANTSAASVPLALAQGIEDGRIKAGQLLLIEAIGGGLTWAASLIRW
ncbi:MAG TPA: beta-ketoacyl-ACP synthase III [Alphaproteobacteria bacterium]|nr:beta-ketoacyl-ACP synthase III [Alphaproteobacteria bacterium]